MKKILSGLQYEIMEKIETYILEHDLKENDKLPSERMLSELFHVSRQTLHDTIVKLCNEHRLKSYQGKGTFIAATPFRIDFQTYSIFRLCAQSSIYTYERYHYMHEKRYPDHDVIQQLQINAREKLYTTINIIQLNHDIIAMETNYSSEQFNNELQDTNLIYKRKKFSLSEATKEEALVLGIAEKAIVFVEVSNLYRNEQILQCTKTIVNAAKVQFTMDDYHKETI